MEIGVRREIENEQKAKKNLIDKWCSEHRAWNNYLIFFIFSFLFLLSSAVSFSFSFLEHYDIALYTTTEQSIIRLIVISKMFWSKNNSNVRKLCNWIKVIRLHKHENIRIDEIKSVNFRLFEHTHTHKPVELDQWISNRIESRNCLVKLTLKPSKLSKNYR